MAEPNLCCVCFDLIFEEEDLEFDLDFEEVQIIHTDYDPYVGPYEVIPKAWEDQILATNGKNMTDDVTVFEVPYDEVTNPTGTTVVIAS